MIRPIKIKTHGRREVSIFKYGLDYISECLLPGYNKLNIKLMQFCRVLNTDILTYVNVLHKNQKFDEMAKFFVGPVKEQFSEQLFRDYLAASPFGYTFKRAGIKETEKGKRWNLTYQHT